MSEETDTLIASAAAGWRHLSEVILNDWWEISAKLKTALDLPASKGGLCKTEFVDASRGPNEYLCELSPGHVGRHEAPSVGAGEDSSGGPEAAKGRASGPSDGSDVDAAEGAPSGPSDGSEAPLPSAPAAPRSDDDASPDRYTPELGLTGGLCECGHTQDKHIYHEGACRPGYRCPNACLRFRRVAPDLEDLKMPDVTDEEGEAFVRAVSDDDVSPGANPVVCGKPHEHAPHAVSGSSWCSGAACPTVDALDLEPLRDLLRHLGSFPAWKPDKSEDRRLSYATYKEVWEAGRALLTQLEGGARG